MLCTNPIRIIRNSQHDLPCGKCLACRIAHRREWSMRSVHELHTTLDQKGLFVTLTYSNEYLPENGTLVKRDAQLFIKRLRKSLYPRRIKYLLAGEYGDKYARPHYHVLLFGCDYDDIPTIRTCWTKCDWLALGSKPFGSVTPKSCQYVSGYIDKKYGGKLSYEVYTKTGREIPFRLVSQSFGAAYLDAYAGTIASNLFIIYNGKRCSLPRYYFLRLKDKHGIDLTDAKAASAEEFEAALVGETLCCPPITLLALAQNNLEMYHHFKFLQKLDREQRQLNLQAALKRRSTFRKVVPF